MKFFAERLAGSDFFRRAVDALPLPSATRIDDLAGFLDVSPQSIRAWLTGKREPPRAAVIAVWHESHLGRSVTSAHSEYGETLARSYAASCEIEIARMRSTIEALRLELAAVKQASTAREIPMNDPAFDSPRRPPLFR